MKPSGDAAGKSAYIAPMDDITARSPPPGAAADWTIPQAWADYAPAEHALWDQLFARQTAILGDRAAPALLHGLEVLKLSNGGIPDFADLSARLKALTGWTVKAVPGLVPDEVFFRHLANRTFVAGRFIRKPDQKIGRAS